MEILKTKSLTFSYPNTQVKALNRVDLSVKAGELLLLMGKSGSGKTTLLRLIKKEISPFGNLDGTIEINAGDVAFVSQNAENTFVSETVRGELAFALENKCLKREEIALKIGEAASFFNITHLLDKKLSDLSGGEKSAVALACAMSTNAKLLLLDEPLAQLDPRYVSQFISLIKRVNDELGTTVIIASHISEGLIDLCDRAVILENGKIKSQGSAYDIAKLDDNLMFYPEFTSLFDERPLTVKEALQCEKCFSQKEKQKMLLSEDDAVKLKNVCFSYGKNLPDVFDMLSLNVSKGEIHSVIGANASGKTTLIKLVAGIKKQYAGKVIINGKCAYVPQNVRYLFSKDKVSEEISEKSAKKFGLDKYLDRHPYDLSSGEQQLLALAIVSEQGFDILLLDEPAKSIDAVGKALLKDYILSQKNDGKTIIIVSHDLDFCGEIADRVSFLSDRCVALSSDKWTVFSSLNLYTTQIRRITSYLTDAVCREDLI